MIADAPHLAGIALQQDAQEVGQRVSEVTMCVRDRVAQFQTPHEAGWAGRYGQDLKGRNQRSDNKAGPRWRAGKGRGTRPKDRGTGKPRALRALAASTGSARVDDCCSWL